MVAADTALAISWAAPASDGGSPITGYAVRVGPFRCDTAGATTCLATGLKNDKRYRVVVRAVNAIGGGRTAHVFGTPTTSQNCAYVGPYANLQGCNFYLADLTGANLTGAFLNGTKLTGSNLTGANLTGDNLTTVTSGGIIGTPAEFPTGWSVADGYLVGPGVNLSHLDLTGADLAGTDLSGSDLYVTDLTGADLTGAFLNGTNMTGTILTGADLTGDNVSTVIWSTTTCPDGTISSNDAGTCANNLG